MENKILTLTVYRNKDNYPLHEYEIPVDLLNSMDIYLDRDDFTELFENEVLGTLLDELSIDSSTVYYDLKKLQM